ncbi:MAG TPA: hypothetical protein VMR81_05870 [Patescibacteria group bacterium]|nr:hypothetical protein [Patescibacteria group bacterium]
MAEETQNPDNDEARFDKSRNMTAVLERALEGAGKIGAKLIDAAGEIFSMIFKR